MKLDKMYIAVLEDVSDFMVPTLVAHSVLNAHIMFCDNSSYINWLANSFKKCVLRVNQKEFNKILALDIPKHLGYEKHTLMGMTSCIVIKPDMDMDVPNVLKFAKLWKPKLK